jgi:serine/threonine protein kinase
MVKEHASSKMLFRRDTLTVACQEDFDVIKCIGRGTFGKVFLVKCRIDGKFYAMKVIRKDIVI